VQAAILLALKACFVFGACNVGKKRETEPMQVMEEILAWWQRFRAVTLARWLYRIFITLKGGNFLDKYQAALVSAVKDLQVPGRTAPLELDKVCVPLRVVEYSPQRMASAEQETQPRDQTPARTLSIEDTLRVSPHVLLLGQPGSGKSTALQNLAFRFIRQEVSADYIRQLTLGRERQPLENLLPVFVSLQEFARSDKGLIAFLAMVFAAHQVPYPQLFIAERLEKGECLLLLDDLDRITEEEQRARVITEIQHLAEQYPLNHVIVTSRPDGQGLLPSFKHWWVLGLDDAGEDALITKWYAEQPERAQALRRALDRSRRLRSLATNPLFLSVLLTGYDSNPEQPVRCAALYEGLLRILSQQEKTSQFALTLKEQVLQEFALELHARRTQSLPKGALLDRMQAILVGSSQTADGVDRLLDELVSDNILWPDAGDTYRFAHLALQEYLAARALFERGELEALAGHVDDPWYEQAFVLLAGLQRKARELIGLIRERSENSRRALLLAARCLAEADQTNGRLRANIEEELFDLFQEEAPELWGEAAAAIAGLEDQSVEATLLSALEAQDPDLRQDAAWALGRVGKEWTVAPLIGTLEDPSPDVRQRAAWALGQIRDKRAIYPLIRTFGDQDQGVAGEAVQAIATLGQSAMEPLINTLSAPKEQARRMAILALSRIGTPAIGLLIEALGDEEELTKKGVLEALARIGDSAVEPLRTAVKDKQTDVAKGAVEALGQIGSERAARALIEMLATADYAVHEDLISALVVAGKPAIGPLVEALGDERVDEAAVEVLHRMASDPVVQDQVIDALIRALPGGRSGRRLKEALQRINGPAVEPLLLALSHDDGHVRGEAAEVLGRIGDERAIRPLIDRLGDTDKAVWEKAARALGAFGDKIEKPLGEALYNGGKPNAILIEPVGAIRTETAKRILITLLEERDREIRDRAARALETYYRVSVVDLYTLWKPKIEELILKYGAVTTHDLVDITRPLAKVILQKYLEDNPEMNLIPEEVGEVFKIQLKGHYRIARCFELWETTVQNLSNDLFVNCVDLLTAHLVETLGLNKPAKPQGYKDLLMFVLDATPIFPDIERLRSLPLVYLQGEEIQEEQLDNFTHLPGNLHIALLVLFSEEAALQRARYFLERLRVQAYDIISLSKKDLQRVFTAKDPRGMLRRIILHGVSLVTISPFVESGPVPKTMFFGRDVEMREIKEQIRSVSYALTGGRAIGKTSILLRLQDTGLPEAGYEARFHYCGNDSTSEMFLERVSSAWLGTSSRSLYDLINQLQGDKPLVILLDEVDRLVDNDSKVGYSLLSDIRALSHENKCRFILAGEWALRKELRNGNSPLYNFGNELLMKRLDYRAVDELITKPMKKLEVELVDEKSLTQRVYDLSAGHPNVVQRLCYRLIQRLNERQTHRLTLNDVESVFADRDFLRRDFQDIFFARATVLEKIIVYIMVTDNKCRTMASIRQALAYIGMKSSAREINEALERLVDLRTILRREQGGYDFAVTALPGVIAQTTTISDTLEDLRNTYLEKGDVV
jgi:HEAT repeat protein